MPDIEPVRLEASDGPKPLTAVKNKRTWSDVFHRAGSVGRIIALFMFLLALGGAGGLVYERSAKPKVVKASPTPQITTLSDAQIRQLSQVGTSLGQANQTLSVAANSVFGGKVDVNGDFTVNGRFNANGPIDLQAINIAGSSTLADLNVQKNLNVNGTVTIANGLNVKNSLNVNGDLNVSGNSSLVNVVAQSITTDRITINGSFSVQHLSTSGDTPTASAGVATGAGGTVNLNGNDSGGVVNINIGSGAGAGTLMYVNFRLPFDTTARVIISPNNGAAAAGQAYAVASTTGFQIRTDIGHGGGQTMSFTYWATQ